MDKHMLYREMKETDIEKVISLYMEYYNNHEDGEWTYQTTYKRIHQVYSREDSLCIVCEKNHEIIGFVMGFFEQFDDIKAYDLVEIVIAYEYQNQGYGTEFMMEIEKIVKSNGGAMIQLQAVNDDMHERFYDKLMYKNCNNLVLKSKWIAEC